MLGTGASLDKYVHSDYDDEGKEVVTASIKSIIYTNLPVDYVIFSAGLSPRPRSIHTYLPDVCAWRIRSPSKKTQPRV